MAQPTLLNENTCCADFCPILSVWKNCHTVNATKRILSSEKYEDGKVK